MALQNVFLSFHDPTIGKTSLIKYSTLLDFICWLVEAPPLMGSAWLIPMLFMSCKSVVYPIVLEPYFWQSNLFRNKQTNPQSILILICTRKHRYHWHHYQQQRCRYPIRLYLQVTETNLKELMYKSNAKPNQKWTTFIEHQLSQKIKAGRMALGLHATLGEWSGTRGMVCILLSSLSFPHFHDSLSTNWCPLIQCPHGKMAESKLPRVYELSLWERNPK